MNSKHHVDRRSSDYRPNTPTPLADSNQEDGWRGLERQNLMVVGIVWSSNNGEGTDNCGSKGTLFYWHSQVYMDYVSRSRFRVLFRRGEKRSILIAQYVLAESQGKDRSKMSTPGPCLYWLLVVVVFSLSLSHRPTPAGVDETGGQQDISLYEIQDSSVQGRTTVYLKFPPFAFHFYAVTCPWSTYVYFQPRRQNSQAPPPPPPLFHSNSSLPNDACDTETPVEC